MKISLGEKIWERLQGLYSKLPYYGLDNYWWHIAFLCYAGDRRNIFKMWHDIVIDKP